MMFFYFLKIIFKISASKRSKTYKKKFNFLETQLQPRFQMLAKHNQALYKFIKN